MGREEPQELELGQGPIFVREGPSLDGPGVWVPAWVTEVINQYAFTVVMFLPWGREHTKQRALCYAEGGTTWTVYPPKKQWTPAPEPPTHQPVAP